MTCPTSCDAPELLDRPTRGCKVVTLVPVTSNDVSPRELNRRRRYAEQRESTRVYKDDEGHTWPEVMSHFGLSLHAAKSRVYKARKERAAEAEERVQPSLPLEDRAQQELSLDGDARESAKDS